MSLVISHHVQRAHCLVVPVQLRGVETSTKEMTTTTTTVNPELPPASHSTGVRLLAKQEDRFIFAPFGIEKKTTTTTNKKAKKISGGQLIRRLSQPA